MSEKQATPKLTTALIESACKAHAAGHVDGTSKTRVYRGDCKDAPAGFGVRVTAKGSAYFVLNYYAHGTERRATIGPYGKSPALSIAAAVKKANELRLRILAGQDPLDDDRKDKAAKQAAAEAANARAVHTLAALIGAYVSALKGQGKPSAREVKNLFDRAVATPFPKIAALPLDAVTVEAFMPAMHRLHKAGSYRDAEKLASYTRTAFNAARASRADASGHAYAALNVRTNPLADLRATRPKVNADAARKVKDERLWTLTQGELAAYWRCIAGIDDAYGAMLRLHLLTGGQRREQLVRIECSDYDAAAHTVRLWDGKGRRSEAREHVLPLLPEAESALLMMAGEKGPHMVTVDEGKTAATPAILDHAMTRVSQAMVIDGEVRRPITPGAIRRTVETLLGASDVPLEIRGQLQSHGLGNVQYRHYDRGDYLPQKTKALTTLRHLCEPAPDNVTPIKRKSAAAR